MHPALPLLLGVAATVAVTLPIAIVAARRQAARARRAERRAQSAERLAEIGAMTAGLAHEIKNPLSTIGLNAQLLAEGINELPRDAPPPDHERHRLVRRIDALHREADRLREILADFLEFAGELRLDTREVNLNDLVEELVDFYLPQAEHNAIRIRAELSPAPLRVALDPPHFKQSVLNLLINATQAMAAHQDDARPRELILRTTPARDNTAELHVIDTGPGIPPDTLDKVFTPYFTTRAGGTGLGLPTTKRLIEAMGGEIDLHTEPARGTDFTLRFPRLPA